MIEAESNYLLFRPKTCFRNNLGNMENFGKPQHLSLGKNKERERRKEREIESEKQRIKERKRPSSYGRAKILKNRLGKRKLVRKRKWRSYSQNDLNRFLFHGADVVVYGVDGDVVDDDVVDDDGVIAAADTEAAHG